MTVSCRLFFSKSVSFKACPNWWQASIPTLSVADESIRRFRTSDPYNISWKTRRRHQEHRHPQELNELLKPKAMELAINTNVTFLVETADFVQIHVTSGPAGLIPPSSVK
jgi:hypothetical protein